MKLDGLNGSREKSILIYEENIYKKGYLKMESNKKDHKKIIKSICIGVAIAGGTALILRKIYIAGRLKQWIVEEEFLQKMFSVNPEFKDSYLKTREQVFNLKK